MKLVFATLMVLAPVLAQAGDSVSTMKNLMKQNESAAIDSCVETTNLVFGRASDLRGQARRDYEEAFKDAGYEDEAAADEGGLSAARLQLGGQQLEVLYNVNEGNGSCSYYTDQGLYLGVIGGTESSAWTLELK